MVRRREVINHLALGGALTALAAPAQGASAAAGTSARADDQSAEEVIKTVQSLRDEIVRQYSFWEIAAVRDQLRTFLRANGRFPDYVDVGIDIWQQVYDWHVRYQQPIALNRTPEGRYAIALMTTAVVMRTDLTPGYIGTPYDAR